MTNTCRTRRFVRTGAAAAALLACAAPAVAEGQGQGDYEDLPDLSRLSLEELAQVEITSVSRRPEAIGQAAAAVFVISDEDIRRSGAASLPEVLRLAPNLQVQRLTAVEYAISARGFNGFETSNKLLVLIDGRSVYSTLHSGVFWDSRNLMLEDIARIEVISGPGGTLYGANAMNGVINIITRSAHDTQGLISSAGVGSEDATLSFRYGGSAGENGAWRAYLSAFSRFDSMHPVDHDASGADASEGVRVGARGDWNLAGGALTLQGDLWSTDTREDDGYSNQPLYLGGGNLLGRWTQPLAGGELSVQAYYDNSHRRGTAFDETVDVYDMHLQHAISLGRRHQVVWGGGYRIVESELDTGDSVSGLVPASRRMTLGNLFVQDQIALREDLTLTLGLKFEENSFTGQEWLPSARLAWRRDNGDLVWGAVSRASRTPNRIERDLTLPGVIEPADFRSEKLTAFELGYRSNPTPSTSLSVSAFYNLYDDLRTTEASAGLTLPVYFGNEGLGENWGVEAWGSWDVNARWRLSAGVSTLGEDFRLEPDSLDISGLASTGDDPSVQVLLRSQADLRDDLELDVRLRGVDELGAVAAYVDADVRLGWRVSDQIELAISGNNLLHEHRVETGDSVRHRAFGRSVYATVRVGF